MLFILTFFFVSFLFLSSFSYFLRIFLISLYPRSLYFKRIERLFVVYFRTLLNWKGKKFMGFAWVFHTAKLYIQNTIKLDWATGFFSFSRFYVVENSMCEKCIYKRNAGRCTLTVLQLFFFSLLLFSTMVLFFYSFALEFSKSSWNLRDFIYFLLSLYFSISYILFSFNLTLLFSSLFFCPTSIASNENSSR